MKNMIRISTGCGDFIANYKSCSSFSRNICSSKQRKMRDFYFRVEIII